MKRVRLTALDCIVFICSCLTLGAGVVGLALGGVDILFVLFTICGGTAVIATILSACHKLREQNRASSTEQNRQK